MANMDCMAHLSCFGNERPGILVVLRLVWAAGKRDVSGFAAEVGAGVTAAGVPGVGAGVPAAVGGLVSAGLGEEGLAATVDAAALGGGFR